MNEYDTGPDEALRQAIHDSQREVEEEFRQALEDSQREYDALRQTAGVTSSDDSRGQVSRGQGSRGQLILRQVNEHARLQFGRIQGMATRARAARATRVAAIRARFGIQSDHELLREVTAPPSILELSGFDAVMQTDYTVKEYLNDDDHNIVLLEGDKVHFTSTEAISVTMKDATLFACHKVGHGGDNINFDIELFNARRLGTLSGFLKMESVREAQVLAVRGVRIFKMTAVQFKVAAVAGRAFIDDREMVSVEHCQAGGGGDVRGLLAVRLDTPISAISVENPDVLLVTRAFEIVTNASVVPESGRELKTMIEERHASLSLRYNEASPVVWSTTNEEFDPNLAKLVRLFAPKLPVVELTHRSYLNIDLDSSFLAYVTGMREFASGRPGLENMFNVRNTVTSLAKNGKTLKKLTLHGIAKATPSFKNLNVLEDVTISYMVHTYSAEMDSTWSLPGLKKLKYTSIIRTPANIAVNARSPIVHLELDLPGYMGSLKFVEKFAATLRSVKVNAPFASEFFDRNLLTRLT